ncbi:hypothetical protein G3480_22865 [Thiorhodococcus mannitoliphagus]|uniref:CopG family transcriptional regulator n=1 Tax=Thiorhodococcus mannitoliphagus TaxID=329406 RepID=A0A6P1E4Z9_9GAMM|nr:hypothetical protein [Thiorhodococcus mannitoliphagus]NEX23104.1 hypothetical protein [Thiorhodococcus mannitoliphagus]
MTSMLEKAFSEASKLPDIEQNALARWVLEEIDSDKKWDALFAESEDSLGILALEALSEEDQGKTTKLDPDEL